MQFGLKYIGEICNLAQLEAAGVALQPSAQLDVAMALQPPAELDEAMPIGPQALLDPKDVSGTWLLAVPPWLVGPVEQDRIARLESFSATTQNYIGLRKSEDEALDRGMKLWNQSGNLNKSTLKLLRIQFSHRGFSKYGNHDLGADHSFSTMFYKNVYTKYNDKDYGAWCFHGNLPLEEYDDDDQWLIVSEWVTGGLDRLS